MHADDKMLIQEVKNQLEKMQKTIFRAYAKNKCCFMNTPCRQKAVSERFVGWCCQDYKIVCVNRKYEGVNNYDHKTRTCTEK